MRPRAGFAGPERVGGGTVRETRPAKRAALALAFGAALLTAGCAASYHPYGWPAGAPPETQKPAR